MLHKVLGEMQHFKLCHRLLFFINVPSEGIFQQTVLHPGRFCQSLMDKEGMDYSSMFQIHTIGKKRKMYQSIDDR